MASNSRPSTIAAASSHATGFFFADTESHRTKRMEQMLAEPFHVLEQRPLPATMEQARADVEVDDGLFPLAPHYPYSSNT